MLATTTTLDRDTSPMDLALASLAAPDRPSLSITPVIHPRDGMPNPLSRTFWSAVANAAYIVRQSSTDLFGKTPDLTDKLALGDDLVDHGRRGPIGCDDEAVAGFALWQAADRAAQDDRPSGPVAHHVVGWLPTGGTRETWRELVLEFLDRAAVTNGMIADWAIHSLADGEGRWLRKPHFHAVLNHRFWRAGRRTGEPNPAWLGTPRQRQRMVEAWEALSTER